MQQIERIISLSEHCEQFVSFACLGVPLNRRLPSEGGDATGSVGSESTEPVAWWTDRKGEIHFYWNADGGSAGRDQSGVHQVRLTTGKVNLVDNSIRYFQVQVPQRFPIPYVLSYESCLKQIIRSIESTLRTPCQISKSSKLVGQSVLLF